MYHEVNINEQIKMLVEQIKNERNAKKKASLRRQLNKLLNKSKQPRIRSGIRTPREINTGIREEVEKLVNPILAQAKSENDRYKELIQDREDNINELQRQREEAVVNGDEGKVEQIDQAIEEEASGKLAIETAQASNVPVDDVPKLLIKLSSVKAGDEGSFRAFVQQEYSSNPQSPFLAKAVVRFNPVLKGNTPRLKALRKQEVERVRQIPEEEAKQQSGTDEEEPNQSNATALGEGKKRGRKVKGGGAGFEDWLSVLGNIPGGSQALGLVPVVGPMLSTMGALGQSGARVGSELGKQATGNPEKMSLSGLSGLKGIFGFGKNDYSGCSQADIEGAGLGDFLKEHKGKLLAGTAGLAGLAGLAKKLSDYAPLLSAMSKGSGKRKKVSYSLADVEGAGLGDLFSGLGGLTGPLSGLIGKLPGAYGQLGSLGNSQVGSASRVFGDVFGKMGMGKRKRKVKGSGVVYSQADFEGAGLGDFFNKHKGKLLAGTAGLAGLAGLAKKAYDYAPLLSAMSKGSGQLGGGRWTPENNYQPEGRLSQSYMASERQINDIVGKRLTKAKDEMKAVKDFNRELANKQNADTQNAVAQLQYAKLLHDVGLIKEAEQKKKRAEKKKKVV
jgi:hypothetical protein